MDIVPSLRLSLALLASAATFATTISAQSAPNIVILYADDMGYGDLGANNPTSKIPTPHLDRLAAQGVRFTDGHSSSGICSPSRYALLTGRYHWRDFHNIVGPFGGPVFKPGQLTLPQMLRQKGYATAAFGKWHLGWDWNAIRRPGPPKDSLKVEDFNWSLPVPGGPLDHWSSAPFRGVKQDLYEGGHRVPFVIRWPGVLKPGRVSDTLISQVDLMATLASLVGYVLPSNAAADSFDFLPYLRSETPVGPRRELVYNTHRDRYGFREGDWALIDTKTGNARPVPATWNEKHQQPADDDLPVELYNLKDDPGQRHNLAAAHPERVAAMQARLKQLRPPD